MCPKGLKEVTPENICGGMYDQGKLKCHIGSVPPLLWLELLFNLL